MFFLFITKQENMFIHTHTQEKERNHPKYWVEKQNNQQAASFPLLNTEQI